MPMVSANRQNPQETISQGEKHLVKVKEGCLLLPSYRSDIDKAIICVYLYLYLYLYILHYLI